MILTTAVLSASMTAPLLALLMLKIAARVPGDASFEYLTVQMKSCVLVESDAVVLQYRNIAMVILTIARLPIIMTAPLFAVQPRRRLRMLSLTRKALFQTAASHGGSCI